MSYFLTKAKPVTDPALVRSEGDRVFIYRDKRRVLCALFRRMAMFILPYMAFLFLLCSYLLRSTTPGSWTHFWIAVEPWFLLAFMVIINLSVAVSVSKGTAPFVILSPEGMEIDRRRYKLELPWDEVQDLYVYKRDFQQFIGIVPRDMNRLCGRLNRRGASQMRHWMRNVALIRAFGLPIAPINLPQQALPLPAEELVARMRVYLDALPVPVAVAEPDVWPPPPSPANWRNLT